MIHAAAQGYFQLDPTDAKDLMVTKANTRLRDEFKRVTKLASGLAERRNNIAHGIVGHNLGRGHFLTPPVYATKKYPISEIPASAWDRAAYAFTAEDIHYYRERFEDLYDSLAALAEELRLWPRRQC